MLRAATHHGESAQNPFLEREREREEERETHAQRNDVDSDGDGVGDGDDDEEDEEEECPFCHSLMAISSLFAHAERCRGGERQTDRQTDRQIDREKKEKKVVKEKKAVTWSESLSLSPRSIWLSLSSSDDDDGSRPPSLSSSLSAHLIAPFFSLSSLSREELREIWNRVRGKKNGQEEENRRRGEERERLMRCSIV